MPANLSILNASEVPKAPELWREIVDASEDGWFWHTHANLEFNLAAGQKFGARDLSFFIVRDGRPIGLVPCAVQTVQFGDFIGWEAAYYSGPLPWPCFRAGEPDAAELEDFAFTELERRAREAGAGRLRVRLSPPRPMAEAPERIARVVTGRRYLDARYVSHAFDLPPDVLSRVRERYRRYHKKYSPQFELSILDWKDVTAAAEQAYFELHVKDAGGQFRSRESYQKQADLARGGEAFFVAARHRERDRIAGMLLVSLYKGAAYDNSVGVDPDFQELYVSHLLKWRAIEELLRRKAISYELGDKADLPSLWRLTSDKQRGITHFKEGWARDGVKTVYIVDKFLDAKFLDAYLTAHADALRRYFDNKSE